MKKTYKTPVARVVELDNTDLIAASPSILGGPNVSATSITDDNMSVFQMDTKENKSLWDSEW